MKKLGASLDPLQFSLLATSQFLFKTSPNSAQTPPVLLLAASGASYFARQRLGQLFFRTSYCTSFLPSLLQETLRSCLCVVRAYANNPKMAPGWPKLCAWQDGAGSQGGVILPCLCVVRAHANVLPAVDAGVSTLRHTRVGGGRRALASRPALTVACQDSTLPASVWASALPASGRASALPASTLGMCTHDA